MAATLNTHGDRTNTRAGVLMLIISSLLCLGALMVFSAGASLDQQLDVRHFWRFATLRQVAFVPIVWLILALAGRVNYHWLLNQRHFWLSPIALASGLSIVALILVLIPGIGTQVNGAWRWFKIGPLTFQPSELAKWSIVLFLAAYSCYRGNKMTSFTRGFLPGCVVLLVIVGLIGKEDFGTAALVAVAGVLVLLMGGARWWHPLLLIPVAALAFYLLVYCNEYRWDRVLAWWYSDSAAEQATAYQAKQSVMAIGAGGLWGCGLGRGTIKMGWIPEDTTDFVFAVIAEELGFVGCALVIGLFVGLIICGMVIARRAPDRLGRLAAVAVTGTIGAQAAMNLVVVTNMTPTKGIALPFVSAGGSGLVMTALAAAVLVNIARSLQARSNTSNVAGINTDQPTAKN